MKTRLASQEAQILRWRLRGFSQKEIGKCLQLSHTTIQRHEKAAMRKIAVRMGRTFDVTWGRYKATLKYLKKHPQEDE